MFDVWTDKINMKINLKQKEVQWPLLYISGPSLWKIYVNDLKPAENTLKYADDTTLYSKVLKSDITVLESSGRNRTILIPDNGMQHAADKAVEPR